MWSGSILISRNQDENKTLSEATLQIWRLYVADIIHNAPHNILMLHVYFDVTCNCATTESTIAEKMAPVYFPSNALRSKIFKKTNGYVYSAKISHG